MIILDTLSSVLSVDELRRVPSSISRCTFTFIYISMFENQILISISISEKEVELNKIHFDKN